MAAEKVVSSMQAALVLAQLSSYGVNLPCAWSMTEEKVCYVCDALTLAINALSAVRGIHND